MSNRSMNNERSSLHVGAGFKEKERGHVVGVLSTLAPHLGFRRRGGRSANDRRKVRHRAVALPWFNNHAGSTVITVGLH
jgi:hypothetical protein